MQYQIAYLNSYGNARVLAEEIANVLPMGRIGPVDLSQQDMSADADTYFLCFEMTQDAIPLEIMDALEYLEGKTLLFFVTCAVPQDDTSNMIERKLSAFLPDGCDYRGIYICMGQVPAKAIRSVRDALQQQPENRRLRQLYSAYQQSANHPNADDLQGVRSFIYDRIYI